MKGRKIKEKERSAIGQYIRNIADIIQKCNDIRSTADIKELYAIFGLKKIERYQYEWNK